MSLGDREIGLWELLELDVAVHVEHVVTTGEVVEARTTIGVRVADDEAVPHHRNRALGFGASRGVVDVRDEKVIDPPSQSTAPWSSKSWTISAPASTSIAAAKGVRVKLSNMLTSAPLSIKNRTISNCFALTAL